MIEESLLIVIPRLSCDRAATCGALDVCLAVTRSRHRRTSNK